MLFGPNVLRCFHGEDSAKTAKTVVEAPGIEPGSGGVPRGVLPTVDYHSPPFHYARHFPPHIVMIVRFPFGYVTTWEWLQLLGPDV